MTKKLRIYYLDDEKDLCENFVDCFSDENIDIKSFSNPKTAIEEIKSNPPDLLFVDFRLPGTTGDKIAQELDPKIPKCLMTGDLAIETKYKFNQIFYKPYEEEKVKNFIEEFIKNKK